MIKKKNGRKAQGNLTLQKNKTKKDIFGSSYCTDKFKKSQGF